MIIFQKSFNQKSTALILIICMIGLVIAPVLLYPKKAQAVCLVSDVGVLGTTGSISIVEWLRKAMDTIFQGKNIAALLANLAIKIWEKAWTIAEWAMGVLLNMLLHQILAQLTNDIVNWIQNGTEPRFLTMGLDDWLGMAVDNALGTFIDQYLGIGWLCEPFDIDIKIALLDQTTFKEESECTLSDIVGNIEDFYNDFSTGGWEGWIKLTEGRNNVYGAYLIALDEKERIEDIEKKEQEAEIARGDGFFSPKDCIWFDTNNRPINLEIDPDTGRRYTIGYKDVWGTPSLPTECAPEPTLGPFETNSKHDDGTTPIALPCYKKCTSHTPGKQISDVVSKSMTNFWDTINAQIGAAASKAGPLSIYVQAILTALVNRAFKEGFGLLFAKDQGIPSKGTLGAGEDMPEIVNPNETLQDKAAAEFLKTTLGLMKLALEELYAEQDINLGILKQILSKYQNGIEPILDQILDPANNCSSGTKSWANGQKQEIENIKQEITDLEAEMADIDLAITSLSSGTVISAVNDYIVAADIFEEAWKTANGQYDPNDPTDALTIAIANVEATKQIAIAAVQDLLTKINGSYTGTTFTTLEQEVSGTYNNIYVILIPAIQTERGNSFSPDPGSLYARLQELVTIKATADSYLCTCLDTCTN